MLTGPMLMPLGLGIGVVAVLHGLALLLGLGVLLAPVQALVAFAYWRMVRPDDRSSEGHVAVVTVTAVGALCGTLLGALAGVSGAGGWAWTAIPLSAIVASAIFSLAFSGGSSTCQLCRQPAPAKASFACPRCQDRVCARPSCWNAKYARCVRCHEREIVILPVVEAWWKPRLGPRVKHGECSHCYKEAHEADLRECGQCRWPMCQRCWDYHNGVCQRCKWVIPDLPPTLAAYVAGAAPSRGRSAPAPGPGRPAPAQAPRHGAAVGPTAAPPGPRRADPRAPQAPGRESAGRESPGREGPGREGAAASASVPQRPRRPDSSGR
jgi:hypothetical protein